MGHTTVQDGMTIDWDVEIPVDDGVVLRADVFRPTDAEPCPVLLTYGPYAKGLSFQEGYPLDQCTTAPLDRMASEWRALYA